MSTFNARWLAHTTLKPGGVPRPFWVADSTTSIPQSSMRISSLATEHTPSRTTRVSGETRFTTSPIILASESTPISSFVRPIRYLRCSVLTSASVYMRERNHLVLLLLQSLLQVHLRDSGSDIGLNLLDLGSIGFKASVRNLLFAQDHFPLHRAHQSAKLSPK